MKISFNAPVIVLMAIVSFLVLMMGASVKPIFSFCPNQLGSINSLTHILGHANYPHYIGNMALLLVAGPPLEEKYGSLKLLGMIIGGAFIGSLFITLFAPQACVIGASGIVFMLIVLSAFGGSNEHTTGGKINIPITLILVVLIYVVPEFLDKGKGDNISHMGHVSGAFSGLLFGMLFRRKKSERNK